MDVLSVIALVVACVSFLAVLTLFVTRREAVYLDGQRMREGADEDYVWVEEGEAGWQKRGRPKFHFDMKPRDMVLVVWRMGTKLHDDFVVIEDDETAELYGKERTSKTA